MLDIELWAEFMNQVTESVLDELSQVFEPYGGVLTEHEKADVRGVFVGMIEVLKDAPSDLDVDTFSSSKVHEIRTVIETAGRQLPKEDADVISAGIGKVVAGFSANYMEAQVDLLKDILRDKQQKPE